MKCLSIFTLCLNRKTLLIMYMSFILPRFDYCWHNCSQEQSLMLEKLNTCAFWSICGAVRSTSHCKRYTETTCLLKKEDIKRIQLLFDRITSNLSPSYLCDLVRPELSETNDYNLRNIDSKQLNSKLYTILNFRLNQTPEFLAYYYTLMFYLYKLQWYQKKHVFYTKCFELNFIL